jgi:hypothetical protein
MRSARRAHARSRLDFPIVAKPDIGWCGHGVRLLADRRELDAYLRAYPRGETFLLQRYLPEPGEAGLFYVREPEAARGRLIGILLRHYPSVSGNGRDSIATLIAGDPRLRRATENSAPRMPLRPDAGAGGGRNGAPVHRRLHPRRRRLSRRQRAATDALLARVDAIASDMGQFLVGRFDVRYSLARVAAARRIHHHGSQRRRLRGRACLGPEVLGREVYRIVFAKQRLLFAIADANRRRGALPISSWELARLWLRQRRVMRLYPPSN